jgi:hypothetical protein
MCRVEGRTVKTTFDIMRLLDGVFSTPQMEPLRRTIGVWFKLLLRRKVPKASVPFFQEMQVLPREAITPG